MKNNNNTNVNPVVENVQTVNPATPVNNVTVYSDDVIDTVTVTPSNPMFISGAMVPQEKGFKAFLKRHRGKFAAVGFLVASNAASYMYGRNNGRKSVSMLVTVPESQYIPEPVSSSEPIDISKEELTNE